MGAGSGSGEGRRPRRVAHELGLDERRLRHPFDGRLGERAVRTVVRAQEQDQTDDERDDEPGFKCGSEHRIGG
jgi:hypothetical protein